MPTLANASQRGPSRAKDTPLARPRVSHRLNTATPPRPLPAVNKALRQQQLLPGGFFMGGFPAPPAWDKGVPMPPTRWGCGRCPPPCTPHSPKNHTAHRGSKRTRVIWGGPVSPWGPPVPRGTKPDHINITLLKNKTVGAGGSSGGKEPTKKPQNQQKQARRARGDTPQISSVV